MKRTTRKPSPERWQPPGPTRGGGGPSAHDGDGTGTLSLTSRHPVRETRPPQDGSPGLPFDADGEWAGDPWPEDFDAAWPDGQSLGFDDDGDTTPPGELSPERLMRLHAHIYAVLPSMQREVWPLADETEPQLPHEPALLAQPPQQAQALVAAGPPGEARDAWLIGPLHEAAAKLTQARGGRPTLVEQTVPTLHSLQAVWRTFDQGAPPLVRGLLPLARLCRGRARGFLMSLFLGLKQVPDQWRAADFVALLPERFAEEVAALEAPARDHWVRLGTDTHLQGEMRALAKGVCAHFGWRLPQACAPAGVASARDEAAKARLLNQVQAVCKRRLATHGDTSGIGAKLCAPDTLDQLITALLNENRSALQSLLPLATGVTQPEWQDARDFLICLFLAAGHTPTSRNRQNLEKSLPAQWHWALRGRLQRARNYWLHTRTNLRTVPATRAVATRICQHFQWG